MTASGTLFGVGVGPGDPDLLTLKAVKIISRAPVIAYPAAEGTDSLARAIAAPHIPDGKTEIAIETPMVPGRFPANDVYDSYAQEIAAHLSAGRDVAILCEGDPFLYGSFMYLFLRLAEDHPTQVVPGVSSLAACAAVAGAPLVSRNQVLTVIPGPLDAAELEARLAGSEAAAIMKVGRHLPKVREVIAKLGRLDRAQYVERATMADQKVLPLTEAPDKAPYFSMILVRSPEAVETPAQAEAAQA
jgi:precorrin-2/cobalt-factor-2 C20-methyltransferase